MLNSLIMIVLSVTEYIDERDFDEYDTDMFSLLNIPQNPSYLDDVIKMAKRCGLKVLNRRNSKSYIKISADKDTWIRFNLYTHDERYCGYKGDVNSLDMTRNVYEGVITPHYEKHIKKQNRMKKYSADNYDSICVYLDENRTPLVFEEKIKELMEEGVFDNEDDARKWLRTTPIELELYYHKGYGLYGVECDAVEMGDVYDPYDGTKMEECEF